MPVVDKNINAFSNSKKLSISSSLSPASKGFVLFCFLDLPEIEAPKQGFSHPEVILPPRGHFAMSGDILLSQLPRGTVPWHSVAGGQECHSTPYKTQGSPPTESDPALNFSSNDTDTLWAKFSINT